jgi:hypothetical protein
MIGVMHVNRQGGRTRRIKAAGHRCPKCRQVWALAASPVQGGFLIACNYCAYQRPVLIPLQELPPRE